MTTRQRGADLPESTQRFLAGVPRHLALFNTGTANRGAQVNADQPGAGPAR